MGHRPESPGNEAWAAPEPELFAGPRAFDHLSTGIHPEDLVRALDAPNDDPPRLVASGPSVPVSFPGDDRVQSIRKARSSLQARTRTASDLLDYHRRFRRAMLSKGQVFSWTRCLLSICSYALLLSDVIRTGAGILRVEGDKPYEPDSVLYYGPYAYPVVRLTMADRSGPMALPTWLFKFDTTSVGMRAVVESLGLETWPPCLNYKGDCAESLSADTVFTMVDSMIEGVANHHPGPDRGQDGTGHLSLRVKAHWKDRLYHHVLPFIFQRLERHTVQAIHYDAQRLNSSSFELCGTTFPRPMYCGDSWTRYSRLCSPNEPLHFLCDHVSTAWTHILQRYRELQGTFSNNTVDLLVLEASQDFSQPSLVYHGRKSMNVVTFIRVQDCTETPCTTIAIDDYRYEAGALTTNVSSWFIVVATLRIIGQLYAWVRLSFLVVGSYVAQPLQAAADGSSPGYTRLLLSLRTVFLIPSQVIIYGSVFPVACYLAAHLIDSSAFYEIVAQQFNTPLGQFKLDIWQFIRMCAVSMRSVWMAALVCHLFHAVYTSRASTPVHSLPGIPEYSLTFMSSLTVFAQVRALAWRSTEVLEVNEAIPQTTRTPFHMLKYDSTHGFIYQFLVGTTLDAQCLTCSLGLLLGTIGVLYSLHRMCPRLLPHKFAFLSWMSVPYGAGRLWPTNALVVSWSVIRESSRAGVLSSAKAWARLQSKPTIAGPPRPKKTNSVSVAPPGPGPMMKGPSKHHTKTNLELSDQSIEFMNYLVNVAVMTDPITWFRLRVIGGHLVAMYRSQRTQRSFMLPYGLTASSTDLPIDWDDLELLMVVDAKDLDWWDLLQCG